MVGEDDGCALEKWKTAGTGGAGELMQQAVAEGSLAASQPRRQSTPLGRGSPPSRSGRWARRATRAGSGESEEASTCRSCAKQLRMLWSCSAANAAVRAGGRIRSTYCARGHAL